MVRKEKRWMTCRMSQKTMNLFCRKQMPVVQRKDGGLQDDQLLITRVDRPAAEETSTFRVFVRQQATVPCTPGSD